MKVYSDMNDDGYGDLDDRSRDGNRRNNRM